jgi:uncharacterized repeat protein (TIGR01451 family)
MYCGGITMHSLKPFPRHSKIILLLTYAMIFTLIFSPVQLASTPIAVASSGDGTAENQNQAEPPRFTREAALLPNYDRQLDPPDKIKADITGSERNDPLFTTTLFSDDFSGDLTKWSIQYGTWHIEQQELVGEAGGYPSLASIYAGETTWTDYEFQTRVVSATLNTVMILRSTGPHENEYYVEFWGEDSPYFSNSYWVYKYQNGEFVELSDGFEPSPVPINNSGVLKVHISGNHLIIYIDGQFVDEIDDPDPLTNGRFGLGVLWEIATFDDVLVSTSPPVSIFPVEQEGYAETGATITYTLELANHTGSTDSFDLQILPGNVWTTTLSTDQVGPISDGASAIFSARVDVPPTALPGDQSIASIQAASVISPSLTGTASIESTATSGSVAYVTSYDHLVLVDSLLHIIIDSIDLTQYGCTMAQQVKLTPNLEHLYVYCPQNLEILVFSTSTNTRAATIALPTGGYQGDITFTRDGAFAVCGSDQTENVYVIDTVTFTIIKTIPSIFPMSLATHPFLPQIYIGGSNCCSQGFIQVLDTTTFSIVSTIRLGTLIHDVQPSPDGQWLYASAFYGGGIYKIDAQTNVIVDEITGSEWFADIKLAPDGLTLFVVDDFNEAVVVIDTASFTLLNSIWIGVNAYDLELTCDGSELWVANGLNTIPVMDTMDFSIPYRIPMPYGSADGIAMCSPNYTGMFASKAADKTHAASSDVVNITLSLYNYGFADSDNIVISDTLPISLNYVEGTLHATSGTADMQNGVITWTGSLTATSSVNIDFGVKVSSSAEIGTSITNTAIFRTEAETFVRETTINIVPHEIFMPCTTRACGPSFFDNFSNPGTGWPIANDEIATLGYMNGEYQVLVKPAGWVVFAYHDYGVSEYKLEVDTRAASHVNGGTGLIFGLSNNGFYLFEISDGWFSLWRNDSGSWAQVIGWIQSGALHMGNETNHLVVVRKQTNITLYANDTMLASTNDGTYLGGGLGMMSESFTANYDGRFDNFSVTTGGCIGSPSTALLPINNLAAEDFWIERSRGPTKP